MASGTDPHGSHGGEHHILPLGVYWAVFLALVVGTILTVWSATIDLGRLNVIVALLIASVKAALVILYFMHVKYSSRMVWIFAAAGFFWVAIMILFTMADFASRSW
ncbi:MAG: cytochrome C oxidase subunit IV family protein [Planctomycetes bacterium]|nr:cytochrome C oxidase subunit IV family protein [Planctomycetota bacterium]